MYRIVNIGAQFNNRGRDALERQINEAEIGGWEVDTVFSVVQTTCVFFKAETYYMILRNRSQSAASQHPIENAPDLQ